MKESFSVPGINHRFFLGMVLRRNDSGKQRQALCILDLKTGAIATFRRPRELADAKNILCTTSRTESGYAAADFIPDTTGADHRIVTVPRLRIVSDLELDDWETLLWYWHDHDRDLRKGRMAIEMIDEIDERPEFLQPEYFGEGDFTEFVEDVPHKYRLKYQLLSLRELAAIYHAVKKEMVLTYDPQARGGKDLAALGDSTGVSCDERIYRLNAKGIG